MNIQGFFSNSMIFPCMVFFRDFPGFPWFPELVGTLNMLPCAIWQWISLSPTCLNSSILLSFSSRSFLSPSPRVCVIVMVSVIVCNYSKTTLTLKAPRKKCIDLKMSSAEVVCCKYCLTLLTNLSIEANSVDPEQTAPIGAVCSGSKLFAIEAF